MKALQEGMIAATAQSEGSADEKRGCSLIRKGPSMARGELCEVGAACGLLTLSSVGLYFTFPWHGGRDQEEFPGHGLGPAVKQIPLSYSWHLPPLALTATFAASN